VILEAPARLPELDAERLRLHLGEHGFAGAVNEILSPHVLSHGGFARAGTDAEAVRTGFRHVMALFQRGALTTQVKQAERELASDMTDETWARHQPLFEDKGYDDGASGGGTR